MDIYFAGDGTKQTDRFLKLLKFNRLMSNNQKSKLTWLEDDLEICFVGPAVKKVNDIMFKKDKNFLVSFAVGKSTLNKTLELYSKNQAKSKFFIDSGAFTTWTKGKKVDVDKYIEFLNANDSQLTIFGQVDDIPGKPGYVASWEDRQIACKNTIENYKYMIERLVSPEKCLYTFHCHNNFKYLEEFLNKEHFIKGKPFKPTYMALGGMGNTSKEERIRFIDKAFQIIKSSKNPNIKVHLFGITSFDLLQYFPEVTSIDSTTWLLTAAMGNILTDSGPLYVSEMKGGEIKIDENTKKRITSYGFSIEQLRKSAECRCIYNAMWMEDKLKNLKFKKLLKLKKLF